MRDGRRSGIGKNRERGRHVNDFDFVLYAEQVGRDNRSRQGRIGAKVISAAADTLDRNHKVPVAASFRNGNSCRQAGPLILRDLMAREGGTNGAISLTPTM